MSPLAVRATFLALALAGVAALGLDSSSRQFAWVEAEDAAGAREMLRGDVTGERLAGPLTVTLEGEGRRLEVTVPAAGKAAQRVAAQLVLFDARGVHRGSGSLDIEESGAFLAGRLEADVGGLALRGGLRVKAGSLAEARQALARPPAGPPQ